MLRGFLLPIRAESDPQLLNSAPRSSSQLQCESNWDWRPAGGGATEYPPPAGAAHWDRCPVTSSATRRVLTEHTVMALLSPLQP